MGKVLIAGWSDTGKAHNRCADRCHAGDEAARQCPPPTPASTLQIGGQSVQHRGGDGITVRLAPAGKVTTSQGVDVGDVCFTHVRVGHSQPTTLGLRLPWDFTPIRAKSDG
ncbi:MAG: hypothetical protein M3529_09305, partial [Actinomycetota bacterium]|nr:hypothetical protein [Actinomycetota bacterium]